MEELKSLLRQADDDYLAGLSNKGTVKRAYKDLELESPALTWKDKEAQIDLREETCIIRVPLGNSGCSCPSRSICRHIVTAILWMKRKYGEKKEEPDICEQKAGSIVDEGNMFIQEADRKIEFDEILNIPTDRLKRACGRRGFTQFIAHIRLGELPDIEESSIITMKLPWENATIKLLEPFSYSTCSCHSKELCVHKAQGVLAYQIKKGMLTLKELEDLQESEAVWDKNLVDKACKSICGEITMQLSTGLSRQSPQVSESMERLAVIAHRSELPELERSLREAATEYQQYFERSAAFRSEVLLGKLLDIYKKADKLMAAQDQKEIRALAGAFRDTYEPVGRLRLVCMGGRTFLGKAGYEGEIYYFWETEKKKWYTWTDVRPVFYEDIRKKPASVSNQSQAPWGLNCTREQMQELEFELINAKAASGGRLSVSQETKAEIIGSRNLEDEKIKQIISWDYEKLLDDNFKGGLKESKDGAGKVNDRRERLALVGAVKWDETDFDEVLQRFSWSIYDRQDRRLYISLKYTKEERLTINMLERLVQRLKNRSGCEIIFFGSLYIDEEGRLCLFPIEFFMREEKDNIETGAVKDIDDSKAINNSKAISNSLNNLQLPVVTTFSLYLKEALGQMSDLFVSGLSSVWDDTIQRLSAFAEDSEGLGLHEAGKEFSNICRLLKEKRHNMEFNPEPVIKAMARLNEYLLACRKKADYDKALCLLNEQ